MLEPLTSREFDDRVSHQFTRIKVKAISRETRHTGQFGLDSMSTELFYCSGLAAPQKAAKSRTRLVKPVFDSVAVTLWKALSMVGIEPRVAGWGSLLAGTSLALVTGR